MAIEALLAPPKPWTREEVVSRPSPVPKTAGVYAWYFRQCPEAVNVESGHRFEGMPMLYVGIAPKRPYKTVAKATRTFTASKSATTTPAAPRARRYD